MLSEFVAKIAELTRGALQPTVTPIPGDPTQVLVTDRAGTQPYLIPPKPIAHRFGSLDSLTSYVGETCERAKVVAFVAPDKVVVVLDPDTRRATVTLPLVTSTAWGAAQLLSAPTGFCAPPKGIIDYLRHSLCVEVPGMVSAIRRVDFKRTSAGHSVNEAGRESLGKSVETVVQGVDEIPESFMIFIPVYCVVGFDATVSLRVSVAVDFEQQQIRLRVHPDEIDRALSSVLERLTTKIGDGGIPAFRGVPSVG